MPVLYHDTNTTATELVNDYASLIQGKTILITGPSPGSLGGHYAQSIAKANPACLILAGRNEAKLEQCVKDIKSESPVIIPGRMSGRRTSRRKSDLPGNSARSNASADLQEQEDG